MRRAKPGATVQLEQVQVPDGDLRQRRTVGTYLLERHLGGGGMGAVFQAVEPTTGRKVALKLFQPRKAKPGEQRRLALRFVREATLAAGLDHPNILRVIDLAQTHDGLLYMVLELLDGQTLQEELALGGALTPVRARHIGGQVAEALRETHEQGLVHRDLKPSNVMLVQRGEDPDFAVLLDFGLVQPPTNYRGSGDTTMPGQILGSPKYAAPEQIMGEGKLDVRADVYAFGILLYSMLAGRAPFHGTVKEVLHAHLMTPPPSIDHPFHDRAAREALEAVARHCMEKDPRDRFSNVQQVIEALGTD